MPKHVIVIGSGLAGMSAAAYLSKQNHQVTVFEKNSTYGGRLQQFSSNGFTFDMGPSWYWMPDLFDSFFADFNYKTEEFYTLKRLDPGYRIYYSDHTHLDVSENMDALKNDLENIENGSSASLENYIKDAQEKYNIATLKFMHKASLSPLEYLHADLITRLGQLNLFKPISKHIREYFKNEKIIHMLEFPSLLLGGKPSDTPALYSLMNYADIVLGTWYPEGGIRSVAKGLYNLACDLGVKFNFNSSVEEILVENGRSSGVKINGEQFLADIVVANADYHHVDQKLLRNGYSNYSHDYWEKRIMSPSSLIFYIGLDQSINDLPHHSLFFDSSFDEHTDNIYDEPKWPIKPLFYVSCTSKSDPSTAPKNGDALFVLIPVATGLEDNDVIREKYFDQVIDRIEKMVKQSFKKNIVFKKSYAHREFVADYNAYKGNAYGLANTLFQTAFLRPKIKNRHLKNLYYTGQLTVPGPGMPPALVSGKIVANQIKEDLNE